ncbi:MAG: HAD family hydrolase, partial [Actinomycetota bacterium]
RGRGGVALDREAVVQRLLDRVIERCREELPWRPGARELLLDCQRVGVPVMLVTMSWRRFADAVLESAPEGTFAGSVTGDEVSRGKPHPEPYLTACTLLDVDPGECLAIEDSPTGVESAWRAGCRTIAIPHVIRFEPPDGVIRLDSLAGRSLADLDALTV